MEDEPRDSSATGQQRLASPSPTADEVEGSHQPLLQLVEVGEIESPEAPLTWTEWRTWRPGAGRRPRSTLPTSSREGRLWRQTMAGLFGDDWQRLIRGARHSAPAPPSAGASEVPGASAGKELALAAPQADRRVWRSNSPGSEWLTRQTKPRRARALKDPGGTCPMSR